MQGEIIRKTNDYVKNALVANNVYFTPPSLDSVKADLVKSGGNS